MEKKPQNDAPETFKEDRISVIEINGYLYGIDLLKSREVFPLPAITPVPNTSSFVLGVFNLRGEIYPLVDISSILGMDPKTLQKSDMVILLDSLKMKTGILADRIHGVRQLTGTGIKSATGAIPKMMSRMMCAMMENMMAQTGSDSLSPEEM